MSVCVNKQYKTKVNINFSLFYCKLSDVSWYMKMTTEDLTFQTPTSHIYTDWDIALLWDVVPKVLFFMYRASNFNFNYQPELLKIVFFFLKTLLEIRTVIQKVLTSSPEDHLAIINTYWLLTRFEVVSRQRHSSSFNWSSKAFTEIW